DLHGSEVCWKKFLNAARFYDADVLICGGDMTGKAIVPIVSENGAFSVVLGGEQQTVPAEQVGEVEATIRRKGYYPLRMSVERLAERIETMASQIADPRRAIFNLHCPPFKSGLDEAPAIDADLKLLHGGRALRPVGSTAVREAIERHQPLLSLHGHIHESKGAVKIGKTLSINPGSAYEEGM